MAGIASAADGSLLAASATATSGGLEGPWFAAFGFCLCAAGFAASQQVSPVLFGEAFTGLKPSVQTYWHATVVALVPNALVPLLELPDIKRMLAGQFADATAILTMAPTPSFSRALGLGCGYIAFDLCVMVVKRHDMFKEFRAPMYFQMLAHHVISLIFWPYAVSVNLAVGYIIYLLATEVTSVWMNCRWICKKLKKDQFSNPCFAFISINFILSYLVVRILPIPWVLWFLVASDKSKLSWSQKVITWTTIPIPVMLNAYWFSLILNVAMGMLKGSGKKDMATPREVHELGSVSEPAPGQERV